MNTPAPYTITPARYAKGKMAVRCPSSDGFKSRASALISGMPGVRYSNREHAYIVSPRCAATFEKQFAEQASAAAPGFTEFLRSELGTRWAICRNTEHNRARWGACITHKRYSELLDYWKRLYPAKAALEDWH